MIKQGILLLAWFEVDDKMNLIRAGRVTYLF